ncbi:MAG: hydroxymethylglutaryl-CoA lyase, partial [Paracoccus sp. (in: a-proteobacteria)]|nr:hydroxymethylglutaryl-CoA lyase [Paracoccus sp. (in: a-proteobacteria)]
MITICDVGPRDGLQNLGRHFSVTERRRIITELAAAGLRHIEAVSMVNPSRVPQMAGAEDLLEGLPDLPGVTLSALALNRKGVERALASRVTELRFAVVASDTFCRKNQNMGRDDSVAAFADIAPMVGQGGRRLTGVIATAYGCPFEGEVDPAIVARMAEQMAREMLGQVWQG